MASINPLTGLPTRTVPPRAPVSGAWGAIRPLAPKPIAMMGTGYTTQQGTPAQRIPGFTPDYQSLIANDPIYKQLQLNTSAEGVSDAASRAAMTQKALIQFGLSPDFNQANNALGLNQSWLGSDITDQTRAAASGNKLSIAARLKDEYQKGLTALRVSLRQRGAVRSGEQGYGQQQALNQYDQANYDATQQLLELISGVQGSFASGERQRAAALVAAQQAAAERQAQLNPATPDTYIPATPATYMPEAAAPIKPKKKGTPTIPLSQLTAKKLKQSGLRAR